MALPADWRQNSNLLLQFRARVVDPPTKSDRPGPYYYMELFPVSDFALRVYNRPCLGLRARILDYTSNRGRPIGGTIVKKTLIALACLAASVLPAGAALLF